MHSRFVLPVLIFLVPAIAHGNAWLREAGTGFFALGGTVNERMDTDYSVYLDYGLSEKATVGAVFDLSMSDQALEAASGELFLRRSLRDGTWASSYQLGVGGRDVSGTIRPFVSGGVSVGRGLSWGQGGWINVDTKLELGETDVSRLKIDSTLGLEIGKRGKGLFQVFLTANEDGDTVTTLQPSYVFAPIEDGPMFQVGIESKSGRDELGLKFGLWSRF